ncbi:hypothetical protein AB2713_19545 [Citrobacter werkmanii]|uniref:hypothetical protein n=1 Tax=Citrobacter werkmanii TaxID=67827 RepID=UPI003464987D
MNKETISVINEFSSFILKVSTVLAVLLGGCILWRYLSLLGITYVFSSVAMQSSLLIIIAVIYIPVSLLIMLVIFFPGMTLSYFSYPALNSDELVNRSRMKCVPLVSLFLAVLNVVSVILLSIYFPSFSPFFIVLGCCVSCFSICTLFVMMFLRKSSRQSETDEIVGDTWWWKIQHTARISFFIYVPSYLAVLSYFLLMPLGFGGIKTYTGVCLFIFISVIAMFFSFLPSCLSFSREGKQLGCKYFVLTVVCAFSILMFIPNLASMLLISSLNNAGVVDYNQYMLYIPEGDMSERFFDHDVWDIKKEDASEGYVTVRGSALFTLGNYTLICPESRTVSSVQVLKNYMKADYDAIFSQNPPALIRLRSVVTSCHLLNKPASQLIVMRVPGENPVPGKEK